MTRKRKINFNTKKESKSTKVLGFSIPKIIVPIIILFVVSSVYMAIQVATTGAKIAKLDTEKRSLQKENEEISNTLINSSSLSELGEKAEELGFTKPEAIMYIKGDKQVAKLP